MGYDSKKHWNPNLYVLNSLGETKEQIWFNQYSISVYEKECENSQLIELKNKEKSQNDLISLKENQVSESNENLNGSVIVERRRISGQFWQTLDLKSFPADIQNLTITLTTPKQANEIKITHCKDKASSVNIKCFVDSQCWR